MTALEIFSGSPSAEPSIPVLETKRLVLRAPRLEDMDQIAALANNRRIAEMTSTIPHPYGIKGAQAWLSTIVVAEGGTTFGIFLKETNALIGACGYAPREESTPEIGYWIGEPYWNRGIATEAARAVIDHAFTEGGLALLLGSCRVTNLASRRVLEKCGFQWTGAGLCSVRALGASVPSDRFRLDQRTWASLRAWGATSLPKSSLQKRARAGRKAK